MDLDTFYNHAKTMPSGFKVLTEEDLDRIGRERRRANRGRWAAIGGVSLLAFFGCLAGTGYASSVLSGSSTPAAEAPAHHVKAPAHRLAKSQSPGHNTSTSDQTSQYQPYLDALANAGVTVQSDWAIQTAQNVEAAWANGETEAQTDQQYLIPGGVYPQHLAIFDAIVHQYFG